MFGQPLILHTDNGKEFRNELIVGLCNRLNIKMVHGRPRTPRTQGQVEKSTKLLNQLSLLNWPIKIGDIDG